MITYEQIQQANQTLKGTDVKGKLYIEVNQRIKAFRMCFPNGTITTEIIAMENGIVTMQTTVKDEDGKVIATGLAQEKESSSYINKTSYIENCETSAVGRALGMCGFGIDTSVASAEEVQNAIENQQPKQEAKQEAPKRDVKLAIPQQVSRIKELYTPEEISTMLGRLKFESLEAVPLNIASEMIKARR